MGWDDKWSHSILINLNVFINLPEEDMKSFFIPVNCPTGNDTLKQHEART